MNSISVYLEKNIISILLILICLGSYVFNRYFDYLDTQLLLLKISCIIVYIYNVFAISPAKNLKIQKLDIAVFFIYLSLFIMGFNDEKYLFAAILGIGIHTLFMVRRIDIQNVYKTILFLLILEILYGFFDFNNLNTGFKGSFDNPVGFATFLVISVPFLYYLFVQRGRNKINATFLMCIFGVALLFSFSRVSIFSCIVITIIWILYIKRQKIAASEMGYKFLITAGIFLLLCTLTLVLYRLKEDSADGRLLIFNSIANMIAEQPLFGYGSDGFKANYMLFQAGYLQLADSSRLDFLADNITSPFNEYFNIIIKYGVVGFLVIFIPFFWIIKRVILERLSPLNMVVLLSMLSLLLISLFSYPYHYAIIILLSMSFFSRICTIDVPNGRVVNGKVVRYMMVFVVVFTGMNLFQNMLYEHTFMRVRHEHFFYPNDSTLSCRLEKLCEKYDCNALKYYYAIYLQNMGEYEKSILMFDQYETRHKDYNTCLYQAENYYNIENHEKTLEYLILASQMCPNRFVPLYREMLIYVELNRRDEANNVARKILAQNVKVLSAEVNHIKMDAKNYLETGILLSQQNNGNAEIQN